MSINWDAIFSESGSPPDESRIHHYTGLKPEDLILRSMVEYEMNTFFQEEKPAEFAQKRLDELRFKAKNMLGYSDEEIEKKMEETLLNAKDLPEQPDIYGDWIKEKGVWRKMSREEHVEDREKNIKYYEKYVKYLNKYNSLKK